jgi:hypothetical protein
MAFHMALSFRHRPDTPSIHLRNLPQLSEPEKTPSFSSLSQRPGQKIQFFTVRCGPAISFFIKNGKALFHAAAMSISGHGQKF